MRKAASDADNFREANKETGAGATYDIGSHDIILAKHDEKSWFQSLTTCGWEGLLVPNLNLAADCNERRGDFVGVSMSSWEPTDGTPADRVHVLGFCSKNSLAPASVYTLKESLPPNCILSTVMETVTALLRKVEGKQVSQSIPQLFRSVEGGYSWNYVMDEEPTLYRCFLCIRPQIDSESNVPEDSSELGGLPPAVTTNHAFVANADAESLKSFGDTSVLTMKAMYGEAHRKFRMLPGDVIVLRGGSPFLIDLPAFEQEKAGKETCRIISWTVSERDPAEGEKEGLRNISVPSPVHTIENILNTVEEAREFYDTEMSELNSRSRDLKDLGEITLYMERLRVTPGLYHYGELKNLLASSENVEDISTWLKT